MNRVARYALVHLAAAHMGVAAFRAATSRHENASWHGELAKLTVEIEEDRDRLESMVAALGVPVDAVPQRVARGGLAGLGHLSSAIHWFGPVSQFYEIEKLRSAVKAKAAGWDALRVAAQADPRLSVEELDELVERAGSQSTRLRAIHLEMAADVLNGH
jgi:hypothetical protein